MTMPAEKFTIANDPYNNEQAVLSIQDLYIKQEEQSNARQEEALLLDEFESSVSCGALQDFQLSTVDAETLASTNNICLDVTNVQQHLMPDYNKMPVELAVTCPSDIKVERSHFVKYQFREGRHVKVWECGVCSKEFGHQYTLMRHLPTHTDERKFQCSTCGKAFRQMSTLSQHRAIHSTERPYICEICRKTFNRVSTLISHRKTHNGLKPHKCHLCSKAFHQKGNLRNHIFTHTNERPYKCDVCNKGFNQMSNLMCHKLKAHQRADKPRYICQICGQDFPKRMILRNHEQYHHGLNNNTLNPSESINPSPNSQSMNHHQRILHSKRETELKDVHEALQGNSGVQTNQNLVSRIDLDNNGKMEGVLVEPINTVAMKTAMKTGQNPFALLKPLNGVPVLVRVLAAGEKQLLVPATADDLRLHGQISVTNSHKENSSDSQEQSVEPKSSETNSATPPRNRIQIKIPVVATVIQSCKTDGSLCIAIHSPGPKEEVADGYMVSTMFDEEQTNSDENINYQDGSNLNPDSIIQVQDNAAPVNLNDNSAIQYIDELGNLMSAEDFRTNSHLMNINTGEYYFPNEQTFVGQNFDGETSVTSVHEEHHFGQTINATQINSIGNVAMSNFNTHNLYSLEAGSQIIENHEIEQKSSLNGNENGTIQSLPDISAASYSDLFYNAETPFNIFQ